MFAAGCMATVSSSSSLIKWIGRLSPEISDVRIPDMLINTAVDVNSLSSGSLLQGSQFRFPVRLLLVVGHLPSSAITLQVCKNS